MNIIVTVDENWAIGSREKLLVQIPAAVSPQVTNRMAPQNSSQLHSRMKR